MEEEEQRLITWEGYVDWKNRPALRGSHGGMLAASFVLVVEILENLAYLANASNLVLYLSKYMHFSPAESANTVTNFMGTAFLLALLGGFLCDALLPTYHVYLLSAAIEFLGLVILTVQARSPSLKPPKCDPHNIPCDSVHGGKAAMLFIGLYLVALGVGGIKGSLPPHGAEQFDENDPKGRKQRSTFFNYFVFCLSCGCLVAVTLVVWIEDNKGWEWGFGISTLSILVSIPIFLAGSPFYRNKIPSGSPLTTIIKVLISATVNSCMKTTPSNAVASMAISPSPPSSSVQQGQQKASSLSASKDSKMLNPSDQTPTTALKFLNKAASADPPHRLLYCSVDQVEQVKIVIKILPIFASTILLNCCLAFNLNQRLFTNYRTYLSSSLMAKRPRASAGLSSESVTKRVGTHNGSFHCDEALGCFMIRLTDKFFGAEIVRSRDPQVLEGLDAVLDVGGVYDPNRDRYDHHQKGFEEVFGHGFTTKLSSAGLVYKHFGKEIIAKELLLEEEHPDVHRLYLAIYRSFMEAIDAIDNGISRYDTDKPARYVNNTHLSARVGRLNLDWIDPDQSPERENEAFQRAVALAGSEFLDNVHFHATSWLPARSIVLECLAARHDIDPSGEIIVLTKFCPWKLHLFELEGEMEIDPSIKYVLYQDDRSKQWRVQAVAVSPDSFESRKPLPSQWRGLRDDELSLEIGIPGGVFVHMSGFVGGNKSYEGALAMARASLKL